VAPAAFAHGFEERRVPEVAQMYDVRRDESIRQSTDRTSVTSSKKANNLPIALLNMKRIAFGTVRLILGTWTTGYSIPSPALEQLRGAARGATVQGQQSFKTRRSDPQAGFGSSTALDPEFFRRTALLACEREILEFPAEQNRFDTDNDHFHSAVRTCRRSSYFRWRFWNSHVISFRRSERNGDPEAPNSGV
jgi:hypothetical protein